MVVMVGTWGGGGNEPTQADTRLEGFITGKGRTQGLDGRPTGMLGQRVATGVSQMCLQEREWGWESKKGTRLVPAGGGTFGRRIRTFHREKKEEHKNKHYPGRW